MAPKRYLQLNVIFDSSPNNRLDIPSTPTLSSLSYALEELVRHHLHWPSAATQAARTMAKLPGVYEPVDPSTYSKIYPDNPNPKITEIADLLIEWYQLLIDMRYIKASNVAFAPHKHLRVNTSEAARFGLSKDVVDLWQMMPYHTKHSQPDWNFGSDAGEFLFWGEFMDDMRGSEVDWWRNAADPFYWVDDLSPDWKQRPEDEHERGWEHERGPYMRPWYAALTNVGNHGSVMVLDTKTCVFPNA